MNHLRKVTFILIMTTCLSFFSNAQITTIDGYYISNTYDTVNCQLEYSKARFTNKKPFINSSSSEIMFLNPNSNKGFFMSPNILYKTKIFKGEKTFFKVISEGDINLYTNGLDLFISNTSDSLMLLKGGKTVVKIKGDSYSRTIEAYKYQIKHYLSDSSYFKEVDKLSFDKNLITTLIKQINNEDQILNEKKEFVQIYHQNYLNIGVNFSLNSIEFTGYEYANDSLFESYGGVPFSGSEPNYNNRQVISSLGAGIKYGSKIGKTNTYLSFGLRFDRLFNTKTEFTGLLHSSITMPSNGDIYYTDIVGKVIDTYKINMSYITLPVTIHHEINNNKLRPFVHLAFINRFYINSGSSIERTIIINDQVTNDFIEIEIPSHLMGLNLGIGVRQLFNIKNSVSYGISVDLLTNKKDSNFKNRNTINFYIMYNL